MTLVFAPPILEVFTYTLKQRGLSVCGKCSAVDEMMLNRRPVYLPVGPPSERDFMECFSTECRRCGSLELYTVGAFYSGQDPLFVNE